MRLTIAIVVALLPTATYALAQQQPNKILTAVQRCGNVVGILEAELAATGERADQLQAALDQANAKVKGLTDKYEPKQGSNAAPAPAN